MHLIIHKSKILQNQEAFFCSALERSLLWAKTLLVLLVSSSFLNYFFLILLRSSVY